MIQLDVAKAGAQLFNLSSLFNARVHDGFTPVKVQWINSTDGNNPLDVKGMKAFLKGQIGQGTIKDDHVELEANSSMVSWEDDGTGSQPNGVTLIKLPPQVFTRDGIFYGYIGLTDTDETVITSINIWFNVDQNVMTAGANVPYYLDEIQAALSAVQRSNDTLQRAKQEIDNQISLSKAAFEPEAFENETALKAKYPAGASGLMVTVDTGHKWLWIKGAWKDCGIYQSAGLDPEIRRRVTYLDTSDAINKNVLQKLTDTVIDIQWFVGTVDPDTGMITPKEKSINAYSSLKRLGKLHTFKISFNSNISFVTIIEFDSNNKLLKHYDLKASGTYAPSEKATAVRFQITSSSDMIGQNGLRDFISASALTITDYGERSVLNDLDHLYIRERLTPLPAIQGKTINTNVDYYEQVNIDALNDVSSYQLINKQCTPGDVFVINTLKGGVNAMGWVFLDSENRLLQKSPIGIVKEQVTLYAPSESARLIVNSETPNCTVFQYAPDDAHLAKINLAEEANNYRNINLAYDSGETVSLVPENVGHYEYIILDCAAGDEFRLKGVGGQNPRLYAFLTIDNNLIYAAPKNEIALDGLDIKAPQQARKLVVNFNTSKNGNPKQIAELYKLPNGTIQKASYDPQCLVEPTVDVQMSAYLNGIEVSEGLAAHLADFAKAGDKMVHVSTFYKVNDMLYMSYYANTRTNAEDPTKHTARLVYAPFDNLTQQTYIDVADVGQSYNNQTIDAIYDSLLLKTSDDSYMIYAFTAKVGGKFHMLYRRFDPQTKLLSDIHEMNFRVGTMTSTFDTISVHDLLGKAGYDYEYEDRDISFIQKLSPRIEDGVTQYYAGIGILHYCFVVKSSDLINWTFVSAPDFSYKPKFEPSVYAKDNYVYYFCRQEDTEGFAILAKYNLTTQKWSEPIEVPDTQSRSDFFEYNNRLYLVHAPLDRNHISLMQIDQNVLAKSREVATAQVNDCFYPFTQNIDGQMYMSFTQSRQHIWLTKFVPHSLIDSDVANIFRKLIQN